MIIGCDIEITILFATPNKKDSMVILADNFKRGAEESGSTFAR